MKNSSDTIGNRTCDLPACTAVPQPTAQFYIYNDEIGSSLYTMAPHIEAHHSVLSRIRTQDPGIRAVEFRSTRL
jgi:hypothetical protein